MEIPYILKPSEEYFVQKVGKIFELTSLNNCQKQLHQRIYWSKDCPFCDQKEEMGEVLHEVDFNQLKIENSQYLEKIDERNQNLLQLKLMAGNVLQVLNTYKVSIC